MVCFTSFRVLRQQILAADLIIAMAAVPKQPWTIQ
jgi:hypothetical protein